LRNLRGATRAALRVVNTHFSSPSELCPISPRAVVGARITDRAIEIEGAGTSPIGYIVIDTSTFRGLSTAFQRSIDQGIITHHVQTFAT
jgi:hypothetical protein